MRVAVLVTGRGDGGWEVELRLDAVDGELIAGHAMETAESAPCPQPAAANLPGSDQPHHALTVDDAELTRVAGRLAGCQPAAGDIEAMGRYLFDSLIGHAAWERVGAVARERAERMVELALMWSSDAVALHALNWELMHDGESFLAGHPDPVSVAITRVVMDAPETDFAPMVAPVRTLFAIGSDLADRQVRAGAEIMGLLRDAERGDAAVKPWVVDGASLSRIAHAVRRIQPHVVHVISHGAVRDGRGQLLLKSDEGNHEEYVSADRLLAHVRDREGRLPGMIVVTGCETGSAAGDHIAPFAVELVAAGVPQVVAMAGRVSDLACRLFTRSFAAAITAGEPLVAAVMHGRRAGLHRHDSPTEDMNWALPAVYLSPDVPADHVPVDTTGSAAAIERVRLYSLDDDPIFCGRRAFTDLFERLMDPNDGLEVVVGYTERRLPGVGKTRLLEELAARALRRGHVVIVISDDGPTKNAPPTTVGQLAVELLRAIDATRRHFRLDRRTDGILLGELAIAMDRPNPLAGTPEAGIPAALQRFLQACARSEQCDDLDPHTLREALLADLKALIHDARNGPDPTVDADSRVILMLGGIERWDRARDALFESLLESTGVGDAEEAMPVFLTCEMDVAAEALSEERQRSLRTRWKQFELLAPFDVEERILACQWVLLHPRPGLHDPYSRQAYAARDLEGSWRTSFGKFLKGLPSEFDDPTLYAIAETLKDSGQLVGACDNDVMKSYLERQS